MKFQNHLKVSVSCLFLILGPLLIWAQDVSDIDEETFRKVLKSHREFISIPNLPANPELMLKNIDWVAKKYEALGFKTTKLSSETLPILLTEKVYDPAFKTILFYFHIDGQPVNADAWDQEDPFKPVLKAPSADGSWQVLEWNQLNGKIDDEWRIYARAAADDKAPIIMFISALEQLQRNNQSPTFNIKVIFDPEEEYSSTALLSTLDTYQERYQSDYFIVMDGPAHTSNRPTLTFGCRGIAFCDITTYGAKLPQHSGHYGNYSPNPVFSLANILSGMKDRSGRVLIRDFYRGVRITPEINEVLQSVPFDSTALNDELGIFTSEKVGDSYQKALQYPSLNVRQIGTSWKGDKLKTVIPKYATANLDVRLVPEIDGSQQLERIKSHLEREGYYVIDREPTDDERLSYRKIVRFDSRTAVNAFRTSPDSDFGWSITSSLARDFGEDPVVIRMMGGTVPIVPLINQLNVPTVIIPMVNMDNNQHSPNENIRVGNMRQGISICLSVLQSKF